MASVDICISGAAFVSQLGDLEKGLQCSGRDWAAVVVVGHAISEMELIFDG